MFWTKFFKKKAKPCITKHTRIMRPGYSPSHMAIYRVIEQDGFPINGLSIAKIMGVDSACITPRLTEMVRAGRIKVHHRTLGLDGHWRNFYVVVK